MQILNRVGPQLPPELTDRIIDYLHGSPVNLRTCARVCRAWLVPSRFHLFYSISIEPIHKYSSCCRLYEALQQSPYIALYVRKLHCSFAIRHDSEGPPDQPSILPQLLRSFTALCTLDISEISWASLPLDVIKSFHDILSLPSLVHLEMSEVNFPKLEDFTGLLRPHLKKLDSSFSDLDDDDDNDVDEDSDVNTDVEEEDEDEDATIRGIRGAEQEVERDVEIEREPCRLHYLMLSPSWLSTQFIDFLLGSQSVVDLSNLHTFECDVEDADFLDMVMRLMKRFGSPVEELIFVLDDYSLDDTDVVDFGHHPNLQVLSLSILADFCTTQYPPHMFATLSAPNLRLVSFEVYISCLEEEPARMFWTGVDRVLSGEKFVSLRSVKIQLTAERDMSDLDIHHIIVDRLPLLMSRGLLEVEVTRS